VLYDTAVIKVIISDLHLSL